MGANASIYLPYDQVDLSELFPSAASVSDAAAQSTHFELSLNGHPVRFNVLPAAELHGHLQSFARWLDSLDEPQQNKADARTLIEHTKTVLGLVAEGEFVDNPALWQSLFQIADRWDGFFFAFDSIVLPNGGVIVGPLGKGG